MPDGAPARNVRRRRDPARRRARPCISGRKDRRRPLTTACRATVDPGSAQHSPRSRRRRNHIAPPRLQPIRRRHRTAGRRHRLGRTDSGDRNRVGARRILRRDRSGSCDLRHRIPGNRSGRRSLLTHRSGNILLFYDFRTARLHALRTRDKTCDGFGAEFDIPEHADRHRNGDYGNRHNEPVHAGLQRHHVIARRIQPRSESRIGRKSMMMQRADPLEGQHLAGARLRQPSARRSPEPAPRRTPRHDGSAPRARPRPPTNGTRLRCAAPRSAAATGGGHRGAPHRAYPRRRS